MYIYLPIAEMPVNIFSILLLGGVTGILSGMFGIGGGFLMTPFLIFLGIPPSVAVATSANQIIAASVSGVQAHWRRKNVDFKMGAYLLGGGLLGSSLGVKLFAYLQAIGLIDLVISLCYIFFLGIIGMLMAIESGKVILRKRRDEPAPAAVERRRRHWLHKLPFKTRFPHSKLYISALLPIAIGILVGILVSLMGIGGGFIMIPAMIYLLGMPTNVVIGTSLFQIIFTTSNVTLLHAISTQSVDVVLALLLLTGSVIGAQYGSRFGSRLPDEQLRAILAMMVILVSLKLAYGLFVEPSDIFTVITEVQDGE